MVSLDIDAVVELPPRGLLVDDAAAGLIAPIAIGGRPGRLGVPRLPAEGVPGPGEVRSLREPLLGRRRLPALTLRGMANRGWGYISSSRGDTFVESVRLQIQIDKTDSPPSDLTSLGRDFDEWFRIAKNWICRWTGQLRELPNSGEGSNIHASIPNADGTLGLFGGGVILGGVVFGERPASRLELASAFDCASVAMDVPLAHEMLLRARVERPRQSAIDACTAAEVALSGYLKERMVEAGVPQDTLVRTLRDAFGVVGLYRLLIVSGGPVSVSENQVMNQLAEPRNLAAHQGDELDTTVAQRAIDTAEAILAVVHPFPSPRDARRSARQRGRDQTK